MFVSYRQYENVQIRNLKRDHETGIWTWKLRYVYKNDKTRWFEFETSKNGKGLFMWNQCGELIQLRGLCDWDITCQTKSGAYRKIKRLHGKYI